ncbi:MAG: hypothetical protein IKK70_05195 [Clostridia bacterium]|nr:hypothetical protein [Clostridia bacterium]
MKNTEFLQNAIGTIDDDLITDAMQPHKNKRSIRVAWALAACFAIVLATLVPMFIGESDEPIVSQSELTSQDHDDYPAQYAENVWSRSDFTVLSVVYGNETKLGGEENESSDIESSSEDAIESEKVSINLDSTIKIESLLADRYIIYYSNVGYPIIYDIADGREVDLTDRIIGSERVDDAEIYNEIVKRLEQSFPGSTDEQINRDIVRILLSYWMSKEAYDESAFAPNMEYLKDHEEYGQIYDVYMPFYPEKLYHIFLDEVWTAYCELPREDYRDKPYSIAPIWIDSVHGMAIVQVCDAFGSSLKTVVYDIVEDKIVQLPLRDAVTFNDGYEIVFSNDGSFFTVSTPRGSVTGANIPDELQSRYSESKHRTVTNYMGESYSVVYIDNYRCVKITDYYGTEGFGCSKAYISENGNVIYYKLMKSEAAGKFFLCDKDVWYNRLERFDSDDDLWTFCSSDSGSVVLRGRFVKLVCNETVAIMERNGSCYAYLIKDGSDVTDEISGDKYGLLAHERLSVYLEDGALYKKDLFNGNFERITECDSYILSPDGAFAFSYVNGDGFVSCINVASGESRRINIDEALCEQIFSDKNAVLKMNYNEADNTLVLSFYSSAEVRDEYEPKDFYSLIAQSDYDHTITDDEGILEQENRYGKVFNVKVDEAVVNAIRQYAVDYDKYEWGHDPSVIYPLGYTPEDKHSDVLRKLGITPPDDYIDMNGTCFVLYEDEDERIELVIGRFLPIYDPPEDYFNNMLEIRYTKNGRLYDLI